MGKLINVAGGAITLFLGLILWILFSVIGGIKAGLGQFDPTLYAAMYASFFLMIFGPILFWIVLPLVGRYRRRRETIEPITYVRKAPSAPEASISTLGPPLEVAAPAPTAMERCPHCGAPLTGKEGEFCHKCWRRIR